MDVLKIKEAGESTLTVSFEGHVTRENAAAAEEEFFRLRGENKQENLVLDFEKLDYISSAGLRVLVKIAKSEPKRVVMTDISPEVYEVLDDTGFVRMFDARKALKQYSSEGFELLGQGANGAVYRVDNENVIKVFQKSAPIEDIERERNLSQQALLEKIPTAISYTVVKVDDCYGIMYELIDAKPLSIGLKEKPEDYDHNVELYISLLKKIHETEGDPEYFPSIKQIYLNGLDDCRDYYTEDEIEKLKALVRSVPDSKTLIHGDYHPNNIMLQDGELLLIDMGDMSIGHPIFDFLSTASTQVNLVKLNKEFAEAHTKMPAELITKTWRRLIDGYFADRSEEDRARIEEQIVIFSRLKVAMAPIYGRGVAQEIIQASVDDAKANFLPAIDDLIGSVDW
jgi:uncharacterized protein (TIGR02172 family)